MSVRFNADDFVLARVTAAAGAVLGGEPAKVSLVFDGMPGATGVVETVEWPDDDIWIVGTDAPAAVAGPPAGDDEVRKRPRVV